MKAAVFYEPKDIRVEEVPGADDRRGRGARRGRRRAASAARTSSTTTARARSAPPTARGRSCSGTSSPGKVVGLGKIAGTYGLAGGRPGRRLPDPELRRVQLLPGGQAAVLRQPVRPRRHDERRLRAVREDEGGPRVQAAGLAHGRAGRVRRDARRRRQRGAARPRSQPDDFAVVYGPGPVGLSMVQLLRNEGARVAVVGTGGYRLDVAKKLGADFVFEGGDDLAEQGAGGERRQPGRPGDRRHRLDGREPAGARDLGPRLDRRSTWA